MKKWIVAFWLAPIALALGEESKLSLFTAIDVGRVENGYDLQKGYDPSGLALNRTYVDVGFTQQLDVHNFISLGVGGIFWKAFEGNGGNPEDKVIKFGPGISNAFMKWSPTNQVDLTFGYFPYKYNSLLPPHRCDLQRVCFHACKAFLFLERTSHSANHRYI